MKHNLLDNRMVVRQYQTKNFWRLLTACGFFAAVWVAVFAGTFVLLYELGIAPQSIAQVGGPFLQAPIVPSLSQEVQQMIGLPALAFRRRLWQAGLPVRPVRQSFNVGGSQAQAGAAWTNKKLTAVPLSLLTLPSAAWHFFWPAFFAKKEMPPAAVSESPAIPALTPAATPVAPPASAHDSATRGGPARPKPGAGGLAIQTPAGPAQLFIPSVKLTANIVFPKSADQDSLDAALKKGVVHYPYSALPGEHGNVYLFGHSTTLPVPESSSYRAFNDIKNLVTGDLVDITYNGVVYEYHVVTIRIGYAQDIAVDFHPEKNLLTLSTCWFHGENWKNRRYVVEAEFVRSYPLPLAGVDNSS